MSKKYKLLKNLPTFKAGDIFTLTENGDLRLKQTVEDLKLSFGGELK